MLRESDPPPFEITRADGRSAFVLVADHAGRAIPAALGSLGVSAADLERHIAWDIGAAGLVRELAERLDAWSILAVYSRLVIDANRPLESSDSIVRVSDSTRIPGNEALTAEEIAARQREVLAPYHARIAAELDRRAAVGQPSVLVSVHSFTPVLAGVARRWHAGVLYGRAARFPRAVLAALAADSELIIGDNEPYSLSDESDYTVIAHGERRGLRHVELEIRQDLITHPTGQIEWAERLARVLTHAEVTESPLEHSRGECRSD